MTAEQANQRSVRKMKMSWSCAKTRKTMTKDVTRITAFAEETDAATVYK